MLFEDYRRRKEDQEDCLDDLAVRMRIKDLVEVPGRDVKDDCNSDVSPGLVVELVHQNHIGKDAHQEICTVDPAGFDEVTLVVASDGRERHMPQAPKGGKYQ